jgi:OOP family OmpA-OmpF porin
MAFQGKRAHRPKTVEEANFPFGLLVATGITRNRSQRSGSNFWRQKMRMILNAMQGVLMITLIGSVSAAGAQEAFYGGIGIGAAKTRIGNHPLGITGATATSLSRDENDVGGKIFFGYRANSYWAAEGGYVDLGTTSAKRSMYAPGVGSISMDSSNTAYFIDLVGRMPIGNGISLIGKVGQIASENRKKLSAGGAVSLAPGTASRYKERETDWKYGAGAEYELSKTMAVRSEVELYRKLGNDDAGGENEAGLFSLNLLFRF